MLLVNGAAMRSPLGPAFAKYCMCELENKVLQDKNTKPSTYMLSLRRRHIYCGPQRRPPSRALDGKSVCTKIYV